MINIIIASFIVGSLSTIGVEFIILTIMTIRRAHNGKESRTENTTNDNK